jgi:hypothetical protein
MNTRLSPRPTTALVVAILALVVALSSSATAALLITGGQIKNGTITKKDVKKNSLTGKQVKDKSIAGKDLKKNAVKGKHVKNHTLTGNDIWFGSLTGEHLRDGSVTLSDASKNLVETLGGGASGFEVVSANSGPAGALINPVTVTASCPADKVAISANAFWAGGKTNAVPPQLRRTGPSTFTAETSFFANVVGSDFIQIQVTCLTAT